MEPIRPGSVKLFSTVLEPGASSPSPTVQFWHQFSCREEKTTTAKVEGKSLNSKGESLYSPYYSDASFTTPYIQQ